jgi:hypothetical protein
VEFLQRHGADPQGQRWGDVAWSDWHAFNAPAVKMIPATSGLYRFRALDEAGLLYIGESGAVKGRRSRLGALARGMMRHPPGYYLQWREAGLPRRPHRGHYAAPFMRQCKDAGCQIEVSWSQDTFPEDTWRLETEERLVSLHRQMMGADPPVQHGGRGMDAYLARRIME